MRHLKYCTIKVIRRHLVTAAEAKTMKGNNLPPSGNQKKNTRLILIWINFPGSPSDGFYRDGAAHFNG